MRETRAGLKETRQVLIEGVPLRFHIRPDTDDTHIIEEVALNPYYQDARSLLDTGAVVIDVGAHIGAFALSCAALGAHVFAWEPLPANYALLTENVYLNGLQGRVKTFNLAAWSSSGERILRVADDSTGGSGFYYGKETAAEIMVPCVRLDEWMEAEGIAHCDLLKLDCEGAEFEILSALSRPAWERIQAVVMEYHLFGGYSLEQLQALIAGQGFALTVRPVEEVGGVVGFLLALRPVIVPSFLSPLEVTRVDSPLTRLPILGHLWRALRRPVHGLIVYYLNQLVVEYNRQLRRIYLYLRMLNNEMPRPGE